MKENRSEAILLSPFRGIFLIALGAFAIWRGWAIHAVRSPWSLCGLGALAIALGAWHLSRPSRPRT